MSVNREVKDLKPVLQRGWAELQRRFWKTEESTKFGVYIAETTRSASRQMELFEAGATQTLQSNHLTGKAFDVYLTKRSEPSKTNYDPTVLTKLGLIWKEMGGVWGGDWKGFVDMPHFEYTGGDTMPWEQQDVPDTQKPSNFALEAMEWAVNNHITDGTAPRAFATREQVVTMLYRFADHMADWIVEGCQRDKI